MLTVDEVEVPTSLLFDDDDVRYESASIGQAISQALKQQFLSVYRQY